LKTEYKTSKHRNNKSLICCSTKAMIGLQMDLSIYGAIHLNTPDRNIWFVSTSNAMLIEYENAASADKSLCGLYKRLSKEGRRADALALRADERRGKLR
jgi:hypothetical protein